MAKVKWAVLGSCGIAKRRTIPEGIIPADNAELVTIYDVATDANTELAAELGVKAAASEAELLASDVDVIYIATPARLHNDHVLAALAADNMYGAGVEELSQAILDGRTSSTDATGGLRSQRVLPACYESAATGKIITL